MNQIISAIPNKKMADMFRFLRVSNKLTQKEVAKMMGVGGKTIRSIEYGRQQPLDKLKQLADYCGLEVVVSFREKTT